MKFNKKKDKDISLMGRILLFFRNLFERIRALHPIKRVASRQKELSGYTDKSSTNEARLAYGFGMAGFYALCALCLIMCVILIFGGSIFSYEKVYYMFKDIEYVNSFNEGRSHILSYSKPLSNQNISVFKDGLAVVSDSEFKFFTSTGRATLSIGSEYSNPKITTSRSHALIYDQGNRSFSVYNSFVSLHSEKLDFPISSAHMSEEGEFCVVTKSKDYGSLIRVYSSDFDLEYEYAKNDYVISARMSSDGKYLAVASLGTEGGSGKVGVTLVNCDKREVAFSLNELGAIPYEISVLSRDRVVLICDTFARVYDIKGNVMAEYVYPHTLSKISMDNDGFALVFDGNTSGEGYIVSAFDKNGRIIRTYNVDSGVFDVKVSNNFMYVLCDREVRRYNLSRLTDEYDSAEFDEEDASLVVFSNGEIMACTPSVAYYISF